MGVITNTTPAKQQAYNLLAEQQSCLFLGVTTSSVPGSFTAGSWRIAAR